MIRRDAQPFGPGTNPTRGKYVLDANGEAIEETDLYTWATWYEAAAGDGRLIVAHDDLPGGICILTVFHALDSRFGLGAGPAQVFRTVVEGGPGDGDERRYATRAEALAGHAEVLAEALSRLPR